MHPPEGTACPPPSVSTHHHPVSYGLLRSPDRHLDPDQALCQPLPSWALATLWSTPRGRVPRGPPRQCGWVRSSHRPQNKAPSWAGERLVVEWCPHILSDTAEPAGVEPGSEQHMSWSPQGPRGVSGRDKQPHGGTGHRPGPTQVLRRTPSTSTACEPGPWSPTWSSPS